MVEYESNRAYAMQMLPFQADLTGRQMNQVNRQIEKVGQITEEDAKRYLDTNTLELMKYLYYISAKYIKRLGEQKYADLIPILYLEDAKLRYDEFIKYIGKTENIKKLQKVFPIIASTCISAHKIGKPEPMFDMVIMDEASQCNIAVSLVPILRGENLMLVGDPQQLNPVIVLDDAVNQTLRKKYGITEEYDYKQSSIYKTYLACDAVSDEILLHNHYRCAKKIIDFNNKKYYNSKLHILTQNGGEGIRPLVFVNVEESRSYEKNTAPAEMEQILSFVLKHPNKSIGVITPFVNQKKLIEQELEQNGIKHVTCGTVHAFQGDEKDVILFSTAITDNTHQGTYDWLKNNKELINVATSRAKEQLIVLSNARNVERLHTDESDDLYELIKYVGTNGTSIVTPKVTNSRALGIKPFSTKTEEAFLQNLTHALGNIWLSESKFVVHKEVPISQVFEDNRNYSDLFYTGRFDFVVYEKQSRSEIPVLAIELDGKEHVEDEVVKLRDQKKNEICRRHHLEIIRVENTYARRYNHIKDILMRYFEVKNR